jgi:short-subunit dehydrogenase
MSKVIVITGSTRGIGYGMAHEFLKRGHRVVISGRTEQSMQTALSQLSAHPEGNLHGIACEVSDYAQVQHLWDESQKHFGKIDIWINNAGIDIENKKFWEHPFSEIERIMQTNLMGIVIPSHIVLKGMVEHNHGTLYNMEGFGSNGMMRVGMTSYGTTKYALRYFTKSLQKEVADNAVIVGTLSPGIVVTELLTGTYTNRPQEWERAKRIFNILADKVETVTPYLVEKVLQNTSKKPAIAWLTTPKIIGRFMTASFNKRKVIE